MSASIDSFLLSDDLLLEIFSKLPLKSLLRSNCVSKTWHRLISGSDGLLRRNPPLITSCMHRLQNEDDDDDASDKKTTSFAWTSSATQPLQNSILHAFFPPILHSSIIDCCNGLLLCYSSATSSYFVCNPISQNWTSLPPPPRKKSLLSLIAHDPFLSPHYVLVLFTECRPRGAEIETFSSEFKVWVRRDLRWNVDTDDLSTTITYFAGVLYIVTFAACIVTVDLQTLKCGRIELPEPARADSCLGRSRGQLHYARSSSSSGSSSSSRGEKVVDVWVLEDSQRSKWTFKCAVRVEGSELPGFHFPFQFNILGFHPVLEVVYFWVPGRILSYDLRSKRFADVCEFGFEMEKGYVIQMWIFPFLNTVQM